MQPKPPSPEHIHAVGLALLSVDVLNTPTAKLAELAINASKAFEREQRKKKRDLSHCKHKIPTIACVQCDT